MENTNYIYLQLAQDVHNDKPRILTESDKINMTIYIDALNKDEMIIINQLIDMVNQKLTDRLNMKN